MKKLIYRIFAMLTVLTVMFSITSTVCNACYAENEIATASVSYENEDDDENSSRRN